LRWRGKWIEKSVLKRKIPLLWTKRRSRKLCRRQERRAVADPTSISLIGRKEQYPSGKAWRVMKKRWRIFVSLRTLKKYCAPHMKERPEERDLMRKKIPMSRFESV
jgi:hypothetical protein